MAKEPLYPHRPSKGEPFYSENQNYHDEQDAVNLINQALNEIRSGRYNSAVWRLADAAGIIGKLVPGTGLIGRDNPTGRGFKITYSQGIWGGSG